MEMNQTRTPAPLGEMIANFPLEALRRAVVDIDRRESEKVVTHETLLAAEAETKLEEVSDKIIQDNL